MHIETRFAIMLARSQFSCTHTSLSTIHNIIGLLSSGKFSHGATFCGFRNRANYCKNKKKCENFTSPVVIALHYNCLENKNC